jgi:hypothetical protein
MRGDVRVAWFKTEAAKKKADRSRADWRRRNPGAPGAGGITVAEKVRLFFAANPGATDEELAKVLGRSPQIIRRFRDPTSKIPYKRDLLRSLTLRRRKECLSALLGAMPQCPRCGGPVRGIWSHSHGTRWIAKCDCSGKRFCLPRGTKFQRPPFKSPSEVKIAAWLDLLAAGLSMRQACLRSGVAGTRGEKMGDFILLEVGGYERTAWRKCWAYRLSTSPP